jgi:GH24 family phage-related lysozyme (muramidase)
MTLKELLIAHEGYRRFPYFDTKGLITIGVGRNLTYDGLRDSEIDLMLTNDIADFTEQLRTRDWFAALEAEGDSTLIRRYALIDMAFMGVAKLDKFVRMIAAIRARDWEAVARECLNSQWARDVRRTRAQNVAHMLRTNTWPEGAGEVGG